MPNTLEGQVCRIADVVAYINHDIGDAIRAGIIAEGDLPASATRIVGHSHSERVNTMVCDIIEQSWTVGEENTADPLITMSSRVLEATNTLRQFLFDKVYNLRSVQEEAEKARETVRSLYHYFNEYQDKLPSEDYLYSDEPERRVVDYIAGMTDQYATRLAEELTG